MVELFKLNYLLWYSYTTKYDINRQTPCAIFLFIIFSSFKFFKNALLIHCFTLTSVLHIFTYQWYVGEKTPIVSSQLTSLMAQW